MSSACRMAMCIRTTSSNAAHFLLLTDGEHVGSCALTRASKDQPMYGGPDKNLLAKVLWFVVRANRQDETV
jgi:hypothetical protein